MISLFRFILDPISVEEFFATYYQKSALHISGARDKFSRLFGWEAMNDVLNSSPQPHPGVRMSHHGKQFKPDDAAGLIKAVQDGATLILKDIDRYSLILGAFLDQLSGEIGERTRFNLYLSQPENQAFNIHYDEQDAFILQVSGYKEWWIFPKTSSATVPFLKAKETGPPLKESCYLHCMLEPGDVLYVPKGHWHHSIAREESSMHLTLAMFVKTGADFTNWLAGNLAGHEEFQKTLPLVFSNVDDSQDHNRDKGFEKIRNQLIEVLNEPNLYERFLQHRIVASHNRQPFEFRSHAVQSIEESDQTRGERKETMNAEGTPKAYHRQLFVDNLDAMDGSETLWGASDVFTGFRDPDLLEWNLNLPGKATSVTTIAVSEIIKDGTFGEIYSSLSDNLNNLRMSQAQIKHFARLHYYKFDPDRWATFLLFTRQDAPVNEDQSNLFVASVGIRDLKLLVVVRKFLRDHVLEATGHPRIVTPL